MSSPAKHGVEHDQALTLPAVGMSRWNSLRHVVPISRESWRKLVNAGRAPKAVKLSERCTMYSNAEVHRWLADPANYRAG
jgi:prophage regulatory protein